ncbi:MAG: diaminopimelate decarboxylase [Muribaculaceae bacterium]|nr:diaminopimelate decarboxylase [Muribaculaceae bacterium]MDE6320909.1 diaminopimelate decarboxylase [Muribaculaceae bacterium]
MKTTPIPTPYYEYNLGVLRSTLEAMLSAIPDPRYRVHYAIKANNNRKILNEIVGTGKIGADCVSGGEVEAAINAGFNPADIMLAGVGKTDREIQLALNAGIGCLNVESLEELEIIHQLATSMGVKAPIALRINPNIDAHTHKYITTGTAENKFGIPLATLDRAIEKALEWADGIELLGLHFHIGSQLLDMQPYVALCHTINEIQHHLDSLGVRLSMIDVGGGLGIDYIHPHENPIPDFGAYFSVFQKHLQLRPHQTLHFELGRSLVAQCGSLITQVTYVKQGLHRKFIIVDSGMTDLIRPALYGAHHHIDNISANEESIREKYDVVGPICESSDTFARDITLPLTHRGDLLAIRSAGAYGEVMASHYNCRQLPQSYFID